MKRAMVDIETMGVTPSATIVQIGACDIDDPEHNLLINVDWTAQKHERESSIDTALWWGSQPDHVKQDVLFGDGRVSLVFALTKLSKWYRDGDFNEIWSQGSFDINILDNAMRMNGMAIPWEFYSARDLRTVLMWLRQYEISPSSGKGDHNALTDAIHQAARLREVEVQVMKK